MVESVSVLRSSYRFQKPHTPISIFTDLLRCSLSHGSVTRARLQRSPQDSAFLDIGHFVTIKSRTIVVVVVTMIIEITVEYNFLSKCIETATLTFHSRAYLLYLVISSSPFFWESLGRRPKSYLLVAFPAINQYSAAEMTRTVFDEIVGNLSKARLGIYLPSYW
ncbi:hypothetical protein V1478_002694 [Vespula squamosa]|uniref:Uncharacterized protein n=1 Tax=Vespula squamosa TaxID=30214 RepID=A0ABD2BTA3_VESSQ